MIGADTSSSSLSRAPYAPRIISVVCRLWSVSPDCSASNSAPTDTLIDCGFAKSESSVVNGCCANARAPQANITAHTVKGLTACCRCNVGARVFTVRLKPDTTGIQSGVRLQPDRDP